MKTEKAIAAIQSRASFLMAEYDAEEKILKFKVCGLGGVSPAQAKKIISQLSLIANQDNLIPDTPQQSWRLPE